MSADGPPPTASDPPRAARDADEGGGSIDAQARALSVSRAALELYRASDIIDLHIDSFIWRRLFGYDLHRRHGRGLLRGCFYSQSDLPRLREARVAGAFWIITTNPLRSRRGRRAALFANLAQLRRDLSSAPDVALATDVASYRAACSRNAHAAFVGIQGGNALELSLEDFDRPELAPVALVTLLHFTRSRLGAPALPRLLAWGDQRLTPFGVEYVRKLNERRILVDLAHIGPRAFWDALAAHDRTQPLTISHAACAALHRHFRNVEDAQIRAVADTGGVIGVIFNTAFLGGPLFSGRAERVVDHLEHVVRSVGADHAALGSDFDGAIVPPRDLRSVLELPRLVDIMLRRGWRDEDVRKVLGGSVLRMLGALRGT